MACRFDGNSKMKTFQWVRYGFRGSGWNGFFHECVGDFGCLGWNVLRAHRSAYGRCGVEMWEVEKNGCKQRKTCASRLFCHAQTSVSFSFICCFHAFLCVRLFGVNVVVSAFLDVSAWEIYCRLCCYGTVSWLLCSLLMISCSFFFALLSEDKLYFGAHEQNEPAEGDEIFVFSQRELGSITMRY